MPPQQPDLSMVVANPAPLKKPLEGHICFICQETCGNIAAVSWLIERFVPVLSDAAT